MPELRGPDLCRRGPAGLYPLARFMRNTGWNATELGKEGLAYADYLAKAMGFPDADLDPAKARPRDSTLQLYPSP